MSEFWKSQPVDRSCSGGIIDKTKSVQSAHTKLPDGLSWRSVNDIPKIVKFLGEFYVEDVSSSYRLFYSEDFFEFLFAFPRHKEEYSLGLFDGEEMVGYIFARIHDMTLKGVRYQVAGVNFLCLSQEYRQRGLAPLLIKEITRIANMNGVHQAIFTSEKDYGFSILSAQYYHFPMNGTNLVKSGMIDYEDEAFKIPKCRDATRIDHSNVDFKQMKASYDRGCDSYVLYEVFDQEIFDYIFQGKKGVLHTVYNEDTGEFASFYIVETACLKSKTTIRRAYLYYWQGTSQIVSDAISVSQTLNVDMFDILNIASNRFLIDKLGLVEGTGTLNYHVYNIKETAKPVETVNFILF